MSVVLVTGCAGFIGMHCAERLLACGEPVLGIDSLNAYYDAALKEARLARLRAYPAFQFQRLDLADRAGMADLFARPRPRHVLHLVAQARVRHSIDTPHSLHRRQPARLCPCAGRLPRCADAAPGLCQQFQRLRRQHQNAVCRKRPGGSPHQLLRRHQEGQRDDGAQLRPPVRSAVYRAALFHRLWPVGTARHGALQVHPRHAGRRGHSALRSLSPGPGAGGQRPPLFDPSNGAQAPLEPQASAPARREGSKSSLAHNVSSFLFVPMPKESPP
jgi:hypothetical protein